MKLITSWTYNTVFMKTLVLTDSSMRIFEWTDCSLSNNIFNILNTCIRYIFDLGKFEHISEYWKWLVSYKRRSKNTLSLLYNVLKSFKSSIYITTFFNYPNMGSSFFQVMRNPLRFLSANATTMPIYRSVEKI